MGVNSQTNRRISRWPLKDSAKESPRGVVINATGFDGRNATAVPLVVEAWDSERACLVVSQPRLRVARPPEAPRRDGFGVASPTNSQECQAS